jgi:hypothetical protein
MWVTLVHALVLRKAGALSKNKLIYLPSLFLTYHFLSFDNVMGGEQINRDFVKAYFKHYKRATNFVIYLMAPLALIIAILNLKYKDLALLDGCLTILWLGLWL